jgi:hypothetical protein
MLNNIFSVHLLKKQAEIAGFEDFYVTLQPKLNV